MQYLDIFGAVYARKGRTKKLKRHGLHGFALDQPSINGIGPINRSEKMKRSQTVANGRKCCRAKVRSPTVSNRFPLDTFGPSKKKLRCAEMFFLKKCGLDKFWPDHVSDRFRPFHFFWTINWTNSIYGRLIQCKPVQTMTLKFFRATLVRVHCTKYCILTLISNIP